MAVLSLKNEALLLAVYLRLRTVNITLTSKVPDVPNVLEVLDVVGGGGSSALPPVGMLPAKMGVDSAHMSASAIATRFMEFAPLRLKRCRSFYIKKNGTATQDFLQGGLERLNISVAFAQLLRLPKVSNLMRTASSKLATSHLNADQEADLRCRTALELKDRSEYDAAREAMFPIWNGIIGSRPKTKGLHDTVVADVLLTTGILTGWLAVAAKSKTQT